LESELAFVVTLDELGKAQSAQWTETMTKWFRQSRRAIESRVFWFTMKVQAKISGILERIRHFL